jgi:uncharacterized protein YndB with AHSA1/START domain
MIDVVNELDRIRRDVGTAQLPPGEARVVRLERTYDAAIDDVWDALTNPERVGRWFMPVTGDFRIGGSYQLQGNAGGKIVECDRPNLFRITWIYGPDADPQGSEVEVRLASAGGEVTRLELIHTAVVPEEFWGVYGPGAVGVGWDGALLGLALHLLGGTVGDPTAWQLSDEGKAWSTGSSERWGAVSRAAGEDADTVASMIANTTSFYTGDPIPGTGDAAN